MQTASLLRLALLLRSARGTTVLPTVFSAENSVTYHGLERNGVEVFLGIPFGQDTGGENRFRPPRPFQPEPGAVIDAQSPGAACPQETGKVRGPLALGNVTNISEDCLNLNIVRPRGCSSASRLPVLIWIYGGSFWVGNNDEPTTAPDGLVLESVENGLPVIHVAINYRLGVFGFTQSKSLEEEKSENAGLRDQRLAIEWVRDNIEAFGGDPAKITIHGQSSGGFAVTAQILAYGGSKPVPFQQGICESQALATGLTTNMTRDAVQVLVDYVGCNTTSLDDAQTISCLQSLDMETLLDASLATYRSDLGDLWLPAIDGDFWPAAPSVLLDQGSFANVTTMIGWTQDDMTLYTDPSIQTAQDTLDSVRATYRYISDTNMAKLLALYPVSDFAAEAAAKGNHHSSEFYRAARIARDILMVCQPLHVAHTLGAVAGNDVFLYDWNQTIVGPALAAVRNLYGVGVPHTAEFAYVFGNLSAYDVNGYPFEPTAADYALVRRGSRSWSTFASTGRPSLEGHDTFVGFGKAYNSSGAEGAAAGDGEPYIFVVGGPYEGLSVVDGPGSIPEVAGQRIRERCAFLNSPEMIEQLGY
ncbi:lipase [Apiospora saccharicola]|uniref:Carboxylic ester hydrolase n=1 Tax=Apiospora saccharicola TaxID=335842 RepID=A0ABR1VL49_9PEZI